MGFVNKGAVSYRPHFCAQRFVLPTVPAVRVKGLATLNVSECRVRANKARRVEEKQDNELGTRSEPARGAGSGKRAN